MINLLQLQERHKEIGLGAFRFGGHSYYEINSDKPFSLNSYGGKKGFILNEKGEVELFEIHTDREWNYYKNGEAIPKERYWAETDDLSSEDEKAQGYTYDSNSSTKWWGKTLDNYYPHPWYPEKEIYAFEVVNHLPGLMSGEYIKKDGDSWYYNTKHSFITYQFKDLLEYPEFFKPLYI